MKSRSKPSNITLEWIVFVKKLLRKKVETFTLVEMLMVVAINMVLISVIVPTYKMIVGKAESMKCMSNHNQLFTAWQLYADDHNGNFVSAWDVVKNHPNSWINDGVGESENDHTTGVLFPYVRYEEVYRCPEDDRHKVSYQLTTAYDYKWTGPHWINVSDIDNPSDSLLFTEEDTWRKEADNAWWLDPNGWRDDIAYWHNRGMNVSFPDGHVRNITWTDPRTYSAEPKTANGFGNVYWQDPQKFNDDFDLMKSLVKGLDESVFLHNYDDVEKELAAESEERNLDATPSTGMRSDGGGVQPVSEQQSRQGANQVITL